MKNTQKRIPILITIVILCSIPSKGLAIDDLEGLDPSSATEEVEGGLDGLLAPIQSYLDQLSELKDDVLGELERVLGDLDGVLEDALGELNLPDPGELMEGIFGDIIASGNNSLDTERDDPINDVQVIVYADAEATQARVATGRIHSQQYLSEENQEAVRAELERMAQLASQSVQLADGSTSLSQQASQIGQQGGEAASASTQASEDAQGRVSTQDAIKDLARIGANQSTQLSQIAQIGSAQSGQLANIGLQLADQMQIDASTLFHITTVATGVAAMQESTGEIAEIQRGQVNAEIIHTQLQNNSLSEINQFGYRLFN